MDYFTKPISRIGIREIADAFFDLFDISRQDSIPVVDLLDPFCKKMGNVTYDIVEDNELDHSVPAVTELDNDGNFTIKIKACVYNGAYYNQTGGYRNHIMHEMCHVFMYKLGYTPRLERSFSNNTIEAMYSAEWQAKALCGEIMMPYEETKNMSVDEICKRYNVSLLSAQQRKRY